MFPSARKAPPRNTNKGVYVPAPVGGMNTVMPGARLPPEDCIYAYDVVAGEYGLRVRMGSDEWAKGMSSKPVRTMMSYKASTAANDKLFACTVDGIYDVTSPTATPTKVVTWGTPSGNAGYCTFHNFVNSAGHFLLVCDEVNGYYTYTGGVWSAGGSVAITGVTAADLVFVTVFKHRVWFVERNTANAWYLDTDAIGGAATKFRFSGKFRAGGTLVGMWNWTYDGGAGIDDVLVGVSSGGDVLVYQGVDPSLAGAFSLKGVYYAGALPSGRRIATEFGGELVLLTSTGLMPMGKLVTGLVSEDKTQYVTYKVSNLFSRAVQDKGSLMGWAAYLHPQENALVVTIPYADGQNSTVLVMALGTKGWTQFRTLPVFSAVQHNGTFYIGTAEGTVLRNRGTLDGVTLADPTAYDPIEWSILTRFDNYGSPLQKRVKMVRPTIIAEGDEPVYETLARYRLDMAAAGSPVGTPAVATGAAWDSATWDTSVWSGAEQYTPYTKTRGASGMGVDFALALRGRSTNRVSIVGFDVLYDEGGFF